MTRLSCITIAPTARADVGSVCHSTRNLSSLLRASLTTFLLFAPCGELWGEETAVRRLPALAIPSVPETLTVSPGLNLQTAEDLAVGTSPALEAIAARVRAARWQSLQEGLPPNPTIGYLGSEIGNEGAAGQQGAFVSQKFIRGGKLDYAAAVACKEARRLEQELAIERLRVLTDTRTAFYEVYLSQLEVDLTERLVEIGRKAADTSGRLFEAGEGRRTDSLQAEIESQRAGAARRRANQRLLAGWRRLAVLAGLPTEAPRPVVGDRDDLLEQLDWEETVGLLVATSPQVAARMAEIEKARCEVAYQESLAVSDVNAQVSVQYDDATGYTVTGVQIGAPLRLWNRNQGGIGRAKADLTAARRRLEATEQSLRRRLAEVFGRYQAAKTLADALQKEVLPRAQKSLDLATTGYEADEISFIEFLTVQRTFFQVNLESLTALRELNSASQLMRGNLLADSGSPE